MNRFVTFLFAACLTACGLMAVADSEALKASAGAYSYTVPHKGPVYLESVAFTLPASTTNDFTISATRDVVERYKVGNQITTNLYNRIETNYNYNVTSEVHTVITTVLYSVSTTNVTSQIYDNDDELPVFQLTEGDKLLYSWTYTNAPFFFIQNIR